MKTQREILATLAELEQQDEALNNGNPYPRHSLHADGNAIPSCNLCSVIAALQWVIGEINHNTGQPVRITPHFTPDEREHLLAKADARARLRVPGEGVNNW